MKYFEDGGKPPSPALAQKVQESMSHPLRYSFVTGNMSVGAASTTYATAKYFQPHDVAQVGTPAANPTEVTYQNFYMYDYFNVSTIINNLYSSIGNSPEFLSQRIAMSCHMEYTVRCQSNVQHTRYQMIRWTVKKPVPRIMCGITEPNTTLFTTNPVYTGNVFNFLGHALQQANINNSAGNATNLGLVNAEIDLKEIPLWNEFFDYKIINFKLKNSQSRRFTCGRRMLQINTSDIYDNDGTVLDTSPAAWTQAFIPGASGIFFRQFGEPMTETGTVSDLNKLAYTQPESILTTKTTYTAYVWKGQPETQSHFFMNDYGIKSSTNVNLRFIDNNNAIAAVLNAI